jgi:hypothetical protein
MNARSRLVLALFCLCLPVLFTESPFGWVLPNIVLNKLRGMDPFQR